MNYALGDTAVWQRWYASPAEVYLWRADVQGAQIRNPEDARLILRAVAKSHGLGMDVRGIAVGWRQDGKPQVDVVLTADSLISSPHMLGMAPQDVARAAEADATLRQRYPGLQFSSPHLLQLTGPADAVDFWRQHDIVWDDKGGPMSPFAKLEGIYRGSADDGARAEPWTTQPPKLNGDNGPRPPSKTLHFLAWAVAGAAIAWLGAHLIMEQT